MYFSSVSAQDIVKGDMNDDGKVSVNDFVMFLDVVLGNSPASILSVSDMIDPNAVDNSIIAGTWYRTKNNYFEFSVDGTTNYNMGGIFRYEYLPYNQCVLLYDATSTAVAAYNVLKITEDSISLNEVGSSEVYTYYGSKPVKYVSSITLNEVAYTLFVDSVFLLESTIEPYNADNIKCIWSSSNDSVATVSEKGLVTAVSPGSAVITCSATDGSGVTATCDIVVNEVVHATSISLSQDDMIMFRDSSIVLNATLYPENVSFPNLIWSSSNDSVATVDENGIVTAVSLGSAVITCYVNDGSGVTDSCNVLVDREFVDLGLPSGLLWATMNVGAEYPEDYGDYFAWGETEPHSDSIYTYDIYKWCKGSKETLIKYCDNPSYGYNGFTDNKTVLDYEDDAAYVNWGGKWRMPTKEEFEELINNTTIEHTTLNNVDGRKFTSNNNGKSIFMPSAGHCWNQGLFNDGVNGYYWSSSLSDHSNPNSAYNVRLVGTNNYSLVEERCLGVSVRPVRSY
jgi:hypothetical protein